MHGLQALARARTASGDLENAIHDHLLYSIGKTTAAASLADWRMALSRAVRDLVVDPWFETTRRIYAEDRKRVYYLSMEFLIGRLLEDAVLNLGIEDHARRAMYRFGVNYDEVVDDEPDAALGNGGLGRLAACFMESMASTGVPGVGYGIRYVHGFFRQEIAEGAQVELPETWLVHGNPWEFERRESSYEIGFGGKVLTQNEPGKPSRQVWRPAERVLAVAFDT
uniref:glycogen/starch/alpha-glucan phosphorylase n=1 Tax=Thalassobaculum salexigens TaxID=455360 RepID=UPI00248E2654